MIRFLRGKEHKAFLRFNKNRTISLSESESSCNDSGGEDMIDFLSEMSSDHDEICFEKGNKEMLKLRENFR